MSQTDSTSPRLLFTVLNWGMGHATRSLPLIEEAGRNGWTVHVASNGTALQFLRTQCAQVRVFFHEKPNQEILYAKRGNRLKIALQMPGFLRNIRTERQWTEQFVAAHDITHVVSDNCYGVNTPRVPCALISHQWHLPVQSIGQWAVDAFVRKQARHFDALWTPDIDDLPGLSGKLGAPTGMPSHLQRIGVLSRLPQSGTPQNWKRVGMVSGPEPQRSLMECALKKWMSHDGLGGLIISGNPDGIVQEDQGVTTWPNPSAEQLAGALQSADTVICRSGYSSLLDLAALGVRAILVPTPGQSEQIYLAEHWAQSFGFAICTQLDLEEGRIPEIQGAIPSQPANMRALETLNNWVHTTTS
ncbi:MAG: glycosyltransferase [Bacteroidetes bacterium]|jgi:hypothetical protein|nr:glycosyltransferase [Bacteroidota bacterium]